MCQISVIVWVVLFNRGQPETATEIYLISTMYSRLSGADVIKQSHKVSHIEEFVAYGYPYPMRNAGCMAQRLSALV